MDILDGAGETLVLLGVVVLQADLEVHRLHELPLLLGATLENGLDALIELVTGHFTHGDSEIIFNEQTLSKESGLSMILSLNIFNCEHKVYIQI